QRRRDSVQLWLPHFPLLDVSAQLRHDNQYWLCVAHYVSYQHDLRKEPNSLYLSEYFASFRLTAKCLFTPFRVFRGSNTEFWMILKNLVEPRNTRNTRKNS
ncbi:MAG: hypothetical protein Q8O37_04955, partial [Sulfuricellaceae bacterium]|nr:hypothetical protein [Sulfuricellaceae bacterium]